MRAKSSPKAGDETPDGFEQDSQYLQEVAHLQTLLTRGSVEEARCFVRELEARWPESDLVRRFSRVLAPPVARLVAGRKGMSREQSQKESAWLREHAGEYPGCWVILDGDRLVTAHPQLRQAIEEADRQVGSDVGSMHYIPPGIAEE
jgi:hypothetical protein